MKSKTTLLGVSLVVLIALGLAVVVSQDTTGQIKLPIVHRPPYIGAYPFIVGSGVLFQNGSAYSYVVINSSAIKRGDSFVGLPAVNTPIGVTDNNFTVEIIYYGSDYAALWLNFSLVVQVFHTTTNFSQFGIGAGARSFTPLGRGGIFSQIAPVLEESSEFEFYFYIGNSSTPAPVLTTGPPS